MDEKETSASSAASHAAPKSSTESSSAPLPIGWVEEPYIIVPKAIKKLDGIHPNTPEEFLEIARDLSKMESKTFRIPPPFFGTSSQKMIVVYLWRMCGRLANGTAPKNGACNTFVGPRGIGKSETLKLFIKLVPSIFPSIISVYVTCVGPDKVFSQNSILQILGPYLGDLDLKDYSLGNLINALIAKNRGLFLIVDELEELYGEKPDTPEGKMYIQTLRELAMIGDQYSNLIYVGLCGSTSKLPSLIASKSLDVQSPLRTQFPLVANTPDLNGTKYSSRYIPSTKPTDIETVAQILGLDLNSFVGIQKARITTFYTGSVLRNVQMAGESFGTTYYIPDLNRKNLDKEKNKNEIIMIYRELYKKNKEKIYDILFPKGQLDRMMVGLLEWEKKFKPATISEISEIFNSPSKARDVLNSLADSSWVIEDEEEEAIYPASLWTLNDLQVKDDTFLQALTQYSNEIFTMENLGNALRENSDFHNTGKLAI